MSLSVYTAARYSDVFAIHGPQNTNIAVVNVYTKAIVVLPYFVRSAYRIDCWRTRDTDQQPAQQHSTAHTAQHKQWPRRFPVGHAERTGARVLEPAPDDLPINSVSTTTATTPCSFILYEYVSHLTYKQSQPTTLS